MVSHHKSNPYQPRPILCQQWEKAKGRPLVDRKQISDHRTLKMISFHLLGGNKYARAGIELHMLNFSLRKQFDGHSEKKLE